MHSAPPSGRELELDVSNIAHGGVAVSRHEGRVVFVADAIPGERVLARISDSGRERFWRADAVRILDASPHRVPHVWTEAGIDRDPAERPGGADFGHIALAEQRRLKATVLREAMQRFAGLEVDPDVEALPGEQDGTGWRTRLRLHVAPDGTVGPYAARSHRVIPVESLPLAVPELRALVPTTADPTRQQLRLVAPSAGPARVIDDGRALLRERVGDRDFVLAEGGFWQVHHAAPVALTRAVQEAVDPALLDPEAANLDLYGGVGLLAAALGDQAGPAFAVTTVESDRRATEHARNNLAEWPGARAETARVERWLRRQGEQSARQRSRSQAATVILDPPRSGAGARVLESLVALRPAQLVYVACDPVALARDAGILERSGYRMSRIRAFDLFPHTHHLEAVATFLPER